MKGNCKKEYGFLKVLLMIVGGVVVIGGIAVAIAGLLKSKGNSCDCDDDFDDFDDDDFDGLDDDDDDGFASDNDFENA